MYAICQNHESDRYCFGQLEPIWALEDFIECHPALPSLPSDVCSKAVEIDRTSTEFCEISTIQACPCFECPNGSPTWEIRQVDLRSEFQRRVPTIFYPHSTLFRANVPCDERC